MVKKEIKNKISIGTIFLLIFMGIILFFILGFNQEEELFVNDKLKDKLGQEITVKGKVHTPKAFYYLKSTENHDESWCLFLDDQSLLKEFRENQNKIFIVKGIVEKRTSNYGTCDDVKQICGKHIDYCINVQKIEEFE